MKKISLTVAALGLAMMLVCPETFAQNRRTSTEQNTNTTTTATTTTATRSTATQPASQTTTNTGTTTTRRTSGTASQPASTTTQSTQTTTRQTTTTPSRQTTTTTSTPSRQTTTTQPSTTTTTNTATAPGGRRNSTTTTTTSQPTTTTETKQSMQPQKPANQTATQPANQPVNNGGTTMRPGGSTTHQNSNGNVTRPNGKTPTTGQPQNYKPEPKPDPHMTKGGHPITPGYRPEALKVKPPKQPAYHNHYHGKPAPPKAFFDMGYHMYGTRINTLPKGHTIRYVNKVKYYYYNGVFYRANNLSGYIITRPPRGYNFDAYSVIFCPIPVLIDPYRDQAVRIAEASSLAKLYARYYPSYRPMDDSYYINNVLASSTYQYYHNDGSYFIESGGRFSVVDAPLGALTDRLPYDYEEVYLGNDLFYLVDNILYGVVCPEGIPYFEVFCVL